MGTLLQDVRYGLRMLVKKPLFTIVAVLTLALGVGANTAIFSIVNAVLLHSLPYRDPDRLVRIFINEPGVGLRDVRFSKPELDDLQTRAGVFEDVTPILEGSEDLTGAGQPERVEGVNTSFSYFSMLGVIPQIGRLYGPQDFTPGFASEAVISDGLWRRAYGADPNVVGRTIRIDNDPLTIIGFCHADSAILDRRFPASRKCLAPPDSAQIPFPSQCVVRGFYLQESDDLSLA
jgi:putative ABC transport system permease protein